MPQWSIQIRYFLTNAYSLTSFNSPPLEFSAISLGFGITRLGSSPAQVNAAMQVSL